MNVETGLTHIEIIYRFILATILGGIIGAERSFFKKQAGLRTFAIVALGASLFAYTSSVFLHNDPTSISRVIANLVVGVGFLGAGIIFLRKNKIFGLTTAAALWITAAIGGTVGVGLYFEAFIVTVLTVIILTLWTYVEKLIRK